MALLDSSYWTLGKFLCFGKVELELEASLHPEHTVYFIHDRCVHKLEQMQEHLRHWQRLVRWLRLACWLR